MPEMRISYAPMTEADLGWVVASEALLHVSPWTAGNFIDSFKAGYYMRVMRIDGEMTAYAVMLYVIDEAHLLNISVIADRQRQGIGTIFLSHLIGESRAFGSRFMFLEVRPSNVAAQALYHKLGFLPIGRRKNYYRAAQGGREDAIVMRLDF